MDGTLTLGYQFLFFLNKFFKFIPYEIVIYSTLPITYKPILKNLKRKYGTFLYLLHKDIFPQSAIDLGLLSKKSIIYKVFRIIEQDLYDFSDKIGVMSCSISKYLLKNNPRIPIDKVELCPNSIYPSSKSYVSALFKESNNVKKKFKLPIYKKIILYGGNVGHAQGIDFIKYFIEFIEDTSEYYFLIVGSGQKLNSLNNYINTRKIVNSKIINQVSKSEYDKILSLSYIGAIFLDDRFTFPNIPSRLLNYCDFNKPVILFSDEITDLSNIITENNFGESLISSINKTSFINIKKSLDRISASYTLYSSNSRLYLENNCNVNLSYKIIMSSFNNFIGKSN